MYRMRSAIAPVTTLLIAASAFAGPGALEISETCAVHTGCFAGDTAGYPVTITSATPGSSFRLTSDLTLPDENTDGIAITKSEVRIDLGGFSIRGVTSCTVNPTVCTTTGTGIGVSGATEDGIEVTNGLINGTGDDCIYVGDNSRVHAIRVEQCGGDGIRSGSHSVVSESSVDSVGDNGVRTGISTIVANTTVTECAGTGIWVASSSVVQNSASYHNDGKGIFGATGATVIGSTANLNAEEGIQMVSDCLVRDSTVNYNGDGGIRFTTQGSIALNNVVNQNGDGEITDHGIECFALACSIRGNLIRGNDGKGISASGTTTGYSDNVIYDNDDGAVSGGTDLGGNLLN